jgi:phosphoenolpyruvate carboxykinase (ATP)
MSATPQSAKSTPDLSVHGFKNLGEIFYNLSRAELYEHTIKLGQGFLSSDGALMCDTGKTTGRCPKDRYIVDQPSIHEHVDWNAINQPTDQATWENRLEQVQGYLTGMDVFVQDVFAGAEKAYRLGVRVISAKPFQALFTQNQFISLDQAVSPEEHNPDWVVVCVPYLKAEDRPSGVHVLLNFDERMILVIGSDYAGEIKKGIFTVLNYLNPLRGVMSMHCSANTGDNGKSAVFFGLSGTGKTSLSADPHRTLIGDDEHGWHDGGVFNYEGGCYAKTINLSAEGEPEIWDACHRFGTVIENVGFDPASRLIDFNDSSKTENTRCGYDLRIIQNSSPTLSGPTPSDIVFLTCDAYGVLPPLSRLTAEQAQVWFLLGYTAKVAGTEVGVTEPSPTFSTCFGAAFMPLKPSVYGDMLSKRIAKHECRVWLLNTGWSGGAYGTGKRISIKYSRAMLHAALDGSLDSVENWTDKRFKLSVPKSCPGVPTEIMNPRDTWSDKAAYDAQADKLAAMFAEAFEKYNADVTDAVKAAVPGA